MEFGVSCVIARRLSGKFIDMNSFNDDNNILRRLYTIKQFKNANKRGLRAC